MLERYDIYCTECLKKGHTKRIGSYAKGTQGVLFLWCKSCKKEVTVKIGGNSNAVNR